MKLPEVNPEPTARAIALLALQIALGYAAAHVHEEGANNHGEQIEFFQRLMGGAPGDPWCADFVSTCLVKGVARAYGLLEDREHLPGYVQAASSMLVPLSGYCPALADGARMRFKLRSHDWSPLPGDLVLFSFTGRGEPHHVGFVEAVQGARLLTVEGNTAAGLGANQADGDGVYRRNRGREHVFGFVAF